MWIDRVKEAKKSLHLSSREISIKTEGKLSERDVIRLINGEYKKPFVDDVIAIGAALSLSPEQLFHETSVVVETKSAAVESDEIKADNESLSAKVKNLEREISYLKELIVHKDKIIRLLEKNLANQ